MPNDDKFTLGERLSNIKNMLAGNFHRKPSDEPWPTFHDDRGWENTWTDQDMSTIEEAIQKRENNNG